MARYRIHRMKDTPRENFRWAAHTSGAAVVKPKDYEATEELEAVTPYAAWKQLGETGCSLRPGDLLESLIEDVADNSLLITKYIGFEPAHWFVPPMKPESGTIPEPNNENDGSSLESHS